MKLSWRDLATSLLLAGGAAVVYAKFYNYSWAVIGSWRSAVAVLAGTGLVMALFSAFDVFNGSWLNLGEMVVALAAIGVAIIGMIVTSEPLFYTLAGTLGFLWLVDTSRHVYHSVMHDTTSTYHTHVTAH